jgi:membrane-associated phospholipid phosphatase
VLTEPPRRRSPIALVVIFTVIFVAALFLDKPLSRWAHDSGIAPYLKNHQILTRIIRIPGNFLEYTLTACAVLIVVQWVGKKPRALDFWAGPMIVLLAGILSAINAVLKLCIGRIRPYHGVPPFEIHPFSRSIVETEAGFSFPSGDASLAFAMAASLSFVVPRLWPLWWILAIIVGLERIAENAHYPSDVVAGAALGVACACCSRWFIRRLLIDPETPPPRGFPLDS